MNKSRFIVLCIAGAVILSFTQFPFAATMPTRTDHAAALDRAYVVYRNADADLMIAKIACATRTGQDRSTCVNQAEATNVKLVFDARENYAK